MKAWVRSILDGSARLPASRRPVARSPRKRRLKPRAARVDVSTARIAAPESTLPQPYLPFPGVCVDCGERAAQTRGACPRCYQRRRTAVESPRKCVMCDRKEPEVVFEYRPNIAGNMRPRTACEKCRRGVRRPGKVGAAAKRKRIRDAYLGCHPCVDCGQNDAGLLEFDHRDPAQKKYTVSSCPSLGVMLVEMGKCDVRCRKCHKARHARECITLRQNVSK